MAAMIIIFTFIVLPHVNCNVSHDI